MSEIDTLLEQVARWEERDSREPLVQFSAAVRGGSPGIEQRVLATLPQATVAARNYLCRELSLIGTAASAPALSRMMGDPATADMACYALARIPDAAAGDALRAALPKSTGTLRLSIVNALGDRRDGKAVPALKALVASPDDAVFIAVVRALSRIAQPVAPSPSLSGKRLATVQRSRVAALRQMGVKELTAALGDPDQNVQAVAIRRLISEPAMLIARYASLSPIGQVRALAALGDGGDRSARPLAVKALQSDSPEIRMTALAALQTLGDTSTVPAVARIAADATGAEQAAARECLAMMRAKGVGEAVASAIGSSSGKLRLELIAAAGDRGEAVAGPALLATAKGPDAEAAQSALRAMRAVAGPEHAAALLDLVLHVESAGLRREAASTLASVLRRTQRPEVGPVIDAYRTASDKQLRLTLLDVMGQVSAPVALPIVRPALSDPDPEIARGAILALTAWQTPEPLPDLLALARSESNAARQVLALRGAVKLTSLPGDRPPAESARLLGECWPLAKQVAERRAILALLPLFPVQESLALAKKAAADATVAKEAAVAIETLAELGVR